MTPPAGGRADPADPANPLDYLSAGTDVELAFGFSGEPEGEVTVRVTGFLP